MKFWIGQFRDAADILKQSNKLIPTELNACLACELYLKYLVNFEKDGIQTKTKKQQAFMYSQVSNFCYIEFSQRQSLHIRV